MSFYVHSHHIQFTQPEDGVRIIWTVDWIAGIIGHNQILVMTPPADVLAHHEHEWSVFFYDPTIWFLFTEIVKKSD